MKDGMKKADCPRKANGQRLGDGFRYKNLKNTYSYGKILYILNPLSEWGESDAV